MNDHTPYTIEPEEVIEKSLIAILDAACTLPIEGALSPVERGYAKELSEDSYISVTVDQTSQDGDYILRAPHTFAARIVVRFALADDPDGSGFRNECRRVRHALRGLLGDQCAKLTDDDFACDAFILDSTFTELNQGENPVQTKTYTATLKGRIKIKEA